MTQEEKQLLIKDLCTRLPYGVKGVSSKGEISPLITRGEEEWDILTSLNYIIVKHGWRPYLRSMSSMTDEEAKEYSNIKYNKILNRREYIRFDIEDKYKNVGIIPIDSYIDWLNTHHFDYRGLIEKNLAIEAPENTYNFK